MKRNSFGDAKENSILFRVHSFSQTMPVLHRCTDIAWNSSSNFEQEREKERVKLLFSLDAIHCFMPNGKLKNHKQSLSLSLFLFLCCWSASDFLFLCRKFTEIYETWASIAKRKSIFSTNTGMSNGKTAVVCLSLTACGHKCERSFLLRLLSCSKWNWTRERETLYTQISNWNRCVFHYVRWYNHCFT